MLLTLLCILLPKTVRRALNQILLKIFFNAIQDVKMLFAKWNFFFIHK